MKPDLDTYLHDHLAGADLAVALLERLAGVTEDALTAALAASVLVEVSEDRETLRRFASSVGAGAATGKEIAAWASEKALRLKLRTGGEDPFGRFETLEVVALGALGKAHLWRALQAVPEAGWRAGVQAGMQPGGQRGEPEQVGAAGLDLGALIARAESQHARVEERRLQLAAVVLHA